MSSIVYVSGLITNGGTITDKRIIKRNLESAAYFRNQLWAIGRNGDVF